MREGGWREEDEGEGLKALRRRLGREAKRQKWRRKERGKKEKDR